MAAPTVDITNRRARFEYELLETFECGMVLTGSEIKSIRAGGAYHPYRYAKCRYLTGDGFGKHACGSSYPLLLDHS